MESFDIDKYNSRECQVHNNGFYLGEQSKQAEVDELKRELLNRTNEAYADGQRSMRKIIKSNEDELQKRIDGIVGIITEAYKSGGNSSVETVYDKIQELLK